VPAHSKHRWHRQRNELTQCRLLLLSHLVVIRKSLSVKANGLVRPFSQTAARPLARRCFFHAREGFRAPGPDADQAKAVCSVDARDQNRATGASQVVRAGARTFPSARWVAQPRPCRVGHPLSMSGLFRTRSEVDTRQSRFAISAYLIPASASGLNVYQCLSDNGALKTGPIIPGHAPSAECGTSRLRGRVPAPVIRAAHATADLTESPRFRPKHPQVQCPFSGSLSCS